MEYGGFELETLGNIKKAYFSVFDNKLRLLDIYRQKQTKTFIYINKIYKQTQTCKKNNKIKLKKKNKNDVRSFVLVGHGIYSSRIGISYVT